MHDRPANRLAGSTSPYLLQHAHNPVDWYPWGDEAFARARERDRPIFLSIGYAACHWCHVMEHESFEDEGTAALMNKRFVSIKVDREERPDLDGIYMDAVQSMTGSGGWPMSVFLTPQGRPFYAGTYYPKEPAYGMPSFRQVLTGIAEAWSDRRDEVTVQASRITDAIARTATLEGSSALDERDRDEATSRLRASFDLEWGGFGGPPRFPQPMTLSFLLARSIAGEDGLLASIKLTLDRMAAGGIHDHVGGGFARYATDTRWLVPHFEKMLYDNAQLASLYVRGWQTTREDHYRDVARDTLDYLLRDLRLPGGGFASSQDADSEGVEGRYYVWGWDELVALVGEPVADAFGATPAGNWEGTNVLWRPEAIEIVAARHDMETLGLTGLLRDAQATLLAARAERVPPATDDKVLAGWNGLAIRALAEAGPALGEPRYIESAAAAAAFCLEHLVDHGGRLHRAWRAGGRSGLGFADDHALLGLGLLALHAATGEARWLREARGLAHTLLERFHDRERGGFFQTADDHESLILRPKDLEDNAVPSGNGAAAELLLRVALLTGDSDLERAGRSAIQLVRDALVRIPTAFGHTLGALDLALGPSREVAIVGSLRSPDTRALLDVVLAEAWRPNLVVAIGEAGDADAAEAAPLLQGRGLVDGRAAAYVCERFACRAPVVGAADLHEELAASATPPTLV